MAMVAAAAALVYGSAAVAPAADVRATAGMGRCANSYTLSQSISGRVTGCLRIGALRPGPYTVVLQQVLNLPTPASRARLRKLGKLRKTRPPYEPAVSLSLSPASGGPGTTVMITGRVRGRPPRRQLGPDFCWDGCTDGLIIYASGPIERVSPTMFRVRIVVPAAPWVQRGPVRIAPLASGDYPIAIQCMLFARGCASGRPEGEVLFHLEVRSPPTWCRTQRSCARLTVTPAASLPADLVRVTGFAPLVLGNGGDQPFGQFELLRGRPRGPQVTFNHYHGTAIFGRGRLDVRAPPSFASLHDTAPIAALSAGLPAIAANPLEPSSVAWCYGTSVDLSSSGTTTSIPTASAAPVLAKLGFQETDGGAFCDALGLIDSSSGTVAAVVAAFAVAPAVGGPPFYDVPLVTSDHGQTWTPLPAPTGSSLEGFGGFRYQGGTLQAAFASRAPGGTRYYPAFNPARPLAEIATPGAAGTPIAWRSDRLGCPSNGPCVTFGPFLEGNCAMIGDTQLLLRSTDGGRRWSQPRLPDLVDACGEAELEATSPRDELLVNSLSPYPLLRSTDAGAKWVDVGLPRLPGEQADAGLGTPPGGITVLSDGRLLLTGYRRGWELLPRGGHAWCPVGTPAASVQRVPLLAAPTVIGPRLWWLTGTPGAQPAPTIHEIPAGAVSC